MHACLSKNKAKGKAFNLEKVDQNIQQLAQEQTFLIVDGKQPAHQSTEHEEACDAVQFPGGARRASDQQVGYGICQMVSIFTSAQPTSRIWYPQPCQVYKILKQILSDVEEEKEDREKKRVSQTLLEKLEKYIIANFVGSMLCEGNEQYEQCKIVGEQ